MGEIVGSANEEKGEDVECKTVKCKMQKCFFGGFLLIAFWILSKLWLGQVTDKFGLGQAYKSSLTICNPNIGSNFLARTRELMQNPPN